MMKKYPLLLVVILLLLPMRQSEAAPLVRLAAAPLPVPDQVQSSVLALLASSSPAGSEAKSYAITNTTKTANGWTASIVGLRTEAGQPWDWWTDGVYYWYAIIGADGRARLAPPPSQPAAPAQQSGPDYVWPWYPNTIVLYGSRGIHEHGAPGGGSWNAIDFVGGHGLADSAPNMAYASMAGTTVSVCRDSKQVSIVTDNDLAYLHLQDWQQAEGVTYEQGQGISPLVLGPISEVNPCGWADQQESHWHLHFAFPSDSMQIESWELTDTGTGEWTQAGTSEKIYPNDWIRAEWTGTPGGPPTVPPPSPAPIPGGGGGIGSVGNFWDLILNGLTSVLNGLVSALLPEPSDRESLTTFVESAAVPLVGLMWVFVFSNLDMTIPLWAMALIIGVELAHAAYATWRFVLKLIPGAS